MKIRTKSLTLITMNVAFLSAVSAQKQEPVYDLDPYSVVSSGRTEKALSTIPQTISLIDEESFETQLNLSLDPIAALSQLLPGFSPSRQKMSGFGETFRGRSPLFMIDGIPQSNPLRDGSRDGYTLDSAMIERIEVIHGASAAQGMGATGGIINFVTIAPPAENGFKNTLVVGSEFSDEFTSDGTGYFASGTTGFRDDKFGYVVSASYKWRPMAYDGEGRLIGVDNTQGDTMHSASTDFFGKFVFNIATDQKIEAMINNLKMEQDLGFVAVAGNPTNGIPTTSVEGTTPGKATQNNVTSASLTYTHNNFAGGALRANVFYQDFAATYGGGEFGAFIYNGNIIFDQSENASEKKGLKLAYIRDLPELFDIGLVAGIDYIEDATEQILVQTGRAWVPLSTYSSIAPYLQLERPFGKFVLSGGIRYEDAELEVGDFTTLESYGSQFVAGGKPTFSETLFNLGLTYEVMPGTTLFASYSQGFGMPDVGRVLRGINIPNQSVTTFLDLKPIVTDNYEIGIRASSASFTYGASLFYSTSDLGSRLSADADGIFSVIREETETYGIELSTTYTLNDMNRFDAKFALVEGKSDQDGDGKPETRLDGTNIPPARLNLGWNAQWNDTIRTRVQTATLFNRDIPTGNDFTGYTLLDVSTNFRLKYGEISVGIANVLDKQYITYYGQSVATSDRYFAGRGRTLNIQYKVSF